MLPTREEYFNKRALFDMDDENDAYAEHKEPDKELYVCPVCGKGVKRDYSIVFMSFPPKYKYMCSNSSCNFKEII